LGSQMLTTFARMPFSYMYLCMGLLATHATRRAFQIFILTKA
jgi:hypothetical protein